MTSLKSLALNSNFASASSNETMGLESKAAGCLLPQLAATPFAFRYLENLDLSGTVVGAPGVTFRTLNSW